MPFDYGTKHFCPLNGESGNAGFARSLQRPESLQHASVSFLNEYARRKVPPEPHNTEREYVEFMGAFELRIHVRKSVPV
jgi:hypothetical protein